MAKTCTLYRIEFPNGRSYVGMTSNFRKRKQGHKKDMKKYATRPLYVAIRRFGWDTLKWDVLDTNVEAETAKFMEMDFIHLFDSKTNGYNFYPDGNGDLVRKAYQDPKKAENLAIGHGSKPFIIKKYGKVLDTFINKSECAREYELNVYCVAKCLNKAEGRTQHKGYTFEYLEALYR